MHLREALLEAAQHLAVPIESQLRMQPAHDVELGHRLAPAFAGAVPHFVERHGVSLGVAHALAEGAQPATGHADIGGVDMAVDVEIGQVAVQPLAHQVGQITHRQDIGRAVERHAVVERKALAGFHLFPDRHKTRIVDYDWHVSDTRFQEENISGPE